MIKLIKYIIPLTGTLLLWGSCKKEMVKTTPLASIKVVNGVTSGSPVRLGSYFLPIYNNQSANFTLPIGSQNFYVWPEGDSLHPYYNGNKTVNVEENDIYTLFLGGTQTSLEGILIKESLPYHSDSTAGIRFVHLAPDCPAVNVTLSTSPDVNQFTDIGYKGITEFKKIPATTANANYTFQIRKAETGEIITSIGMSGARLPTFVPRFRNVTLVFKGMVGGQPAPSIIRVNHY